MIGTPRLGPDQPLLCGVRAGLVAIISQVGRQRNRMPGPAASSLRFVHGIGYHRGPRLTSGPRFLALLAKASWSAPTSETAGLIGHPVAEERSFVHQHTLEPSQQCEPAAGATTWMVAHMRAKLALTWTRLHEKTCRYRYKPC